MAGVPKQFWALGAILVGVNLAGWVWVANKSPTRADGRIRVLSALPTKDVDTTDRFVLVFDESLPLTQPLGAPLDRPPFDVRPPISGRWQWAAADRLEFVLSNPLPPSRRFTIAPSAELEKQLGRVLVGPSEFQFQTRPVEVTACNFHSADGQHANIELRFSQPVDPAALLTRATCSDPSSGANLTATTVTAEPADKILLRVQRPASGRLKLDIAAHLTANGGDVPMPAPWSGTVEVSPRFALLRTWSYPPSFDADVTVELGFSQDLDRSAVLPKFTLNPPVPGAQLRHSYGSELRLEGPLECGRRYSVTIEGDLRSAAGELLGEPQSIAFDIPDRSPGLHFPQSAGRLMPGGNLTLDLDAVNVGAFELRAARVHPNNLAAHIRGDEPKATARELSTKKIKVDSTRNQPQHLAVDLAGLLQQPLGIYQIEADATDQNWTRDSAVVCVTNLAITSKREHDGLFVWITSLSDAQPSADVEVMAISFNNQTLATSVTDVDGVARLAIPADHPDGEPWLITAGKGDDLSFHVPDRREWMLDNVDCTGHAIAGEYDAMLYTERGAYRPGEPIHLTGIIRDKEGNTPPSFPLTIRVTRPDGRRTAELPIAAADSAAEITEADPFAARVGPQGVFQITIPTRSDAQTGRYRFTATLPGDDTTLGETTALVEAFVPARIAVTAEAPSRVTDFNALSLRVAARYLFGQPAAGLPVRLSGEFRTAPYESPRFPDFTFGDPTCTARHAAKELDATLDSSGAATLTCPPPEVNPDSQCRTITDGIELWSTSPAAMRWKARLVATVTEPGGRSTSAEAETTIDSAASFIGLCLPSGRTTPANAPFDVHCIRVASDDSLRPTGNIELRLLRVEHDNLLEQVNGRPVWKSQERCTAVATRTLSEPTSATSAQPAAVQFDAAPPGRYRLQARDRDAGSFAQLEFDIVAPGDSTQSVSYEQPEQLELTLDHERYTPGDTATLSIRSPFAGTLFVTLETDRVLTHRVLAMSENATTVELPLDSKLRGGAFVSALVVRPIDPRQTDWLPHRAFGLARVITDHATAELPLQLTASTRAEPGEMTQVSVCTPPTAENEPPPVIHVWAVDEGVLLTTAFKTPNPLHHFLGQRAASVTTADDFGDLLPDHLRPADMTRIGAGESGDKSDWDDAEAIRRGPVSAPARPRTVIWHSAAIASPDGTTEFETTLPDFTGELRFMAVAVAGDRYGSAQSATTISAPLLVESMCPRAVAPGDRFDIPVRIFNSSDAELEVAIEAHVDGPLTIQTPAAAVTRVEHGKPATIWLTATATALGPVKIQFRARASNRPDIRPAHTNAALAVRPAGPLHTDAELLRIRAGGSHEIAAPRGFLPGSTRTLVSISRNPTVELRPALQHLLDYPHGCVEQTTSRLFALLHTPYLLAPATGETATTSDTARAAAARDMIAAGIVRLWSMQTRSGGLAYWPGDAVPYLWGSANAGLFLAQAQRAGYAIDPRFITELTDYLQSAMDRPGSDDLDDNERALLCLVLASFDRPPQGWMARLSERLDDLDIAGRAHLAGAWLALGRRDRANAVLPDDTPALPVVATTGGRLTSAVHQDAALLDVLLDLDPEHAWIPALVQRLEAARQHGAWGSTLENAAALAALARYQSRAADDSEFEGGIETARAGRYPFTSAAPAAFEFTTEDFPLKLHTAGRGSICTSIITEGLLADAAIETYDRRLRIRRNWSDAAGTTIDAAKLRVGDLIYVDVTIAAPDVDENELIENIAIVDVLPGGCEVENPRLATSATGAAAENTAKYDTPDRTEFLDDRVVLFTSAGREVRHFRYLLRIVTVGQFKLPPIQASCMYDAACASVFGGGQAEVTR